MYVVRNIFQAKPGKAKDLAKVFHGVLPLMREAGVVQACRVLTDASASFWTVVIESDVEDIGKYFDALANLGTNTAIREKMAGYMELTTGGHREIWKVENP